MKGHAKIKVEIKNGVLFVYHNDGTLLHKRKATLQTWEKIWQVIENKETMREQNDKIEKFFAKVDNITFKAVKIMVVFLPLYILFQIIFNS
jgi:hypothetical protein